jgi:hypothetical protein
MPVVLAPINDVGIYIHMQHGSLVAYCMAVPMLAPIFFYLLTNLLFYRKKL